MFPVKIKLTASAIFVLLLSGCITQAERFARMTPEEIHKWTNEELCANGHRPNPSIKSELLNRKLLTEQEFNFMFMSNEHQHFPQKGMRKCAMWTYTHGGDLLSKTTAPDGTVRETWKVHRGEYIISKSTGGRYYLITIENDIITSVSPPL